MPKIDTENLLVRCAVGACIGMVLAAMLTVVFAAGKYWWLQKSGSDALAYAVGSTVDVPSEFYSGAHSTALLFVDAACGASNRSKEELRRLVQTLMAVHSRILLVTGKSLPESHQEFAQAIGLDVASIRRLDVASLRLRYVPTLVVVRHDGKVAYSHEGAMPSGAGVPVVEQVAKLMAGQGNERN